VAWAPDYVTEDELASYLRIADPLDDPQLALAIAGASRAIDQATNRQFGRVDAPEVRTYRARPDYELGRWVVDIDDTQEAPTAVEVDGTAVASFALEPRNAAQEGRAWTRLVFTGDSEATPCASSDVAVTARWGWTAVPATIQQACLLQASRLHKRRDAPFGVAGSPDMGSELRLLAKVDPDVEVMLRAYRRPRAVG
jgi:hypothetical protein